MEDSLDVFVYDHGKLGTRLSLPWSVAESRSLGLTSHISTSAGKALGRVYH